MASLSDNPPVLPPLTLPQTQIDLTPSSRPNSSQQPTTQPVLPSYSASGPPPLYKEPGTGGEEFYTIPLHDVLSEKPIQNERRQTKLMWIFWFASLIAFTFALAICILLSTIHGKPYMAPPVPQLIFAMSGLLVISAGLCAAGVGLWLQKRARRNRRHASADEKKVKNGQGDEEGAVGRPESRGSTTKQESGRGM